jgi:hypothetical protein
MSMSTKTHQTPSAERIKEVMDLISDKSMSSFNTGDWTPLTPEEIRDFLFLAERALVSDGFSSTVVVRVGVKLRLALADTP